MHQSRYCDTAKNRIDSMCTALASAPPLDFVAARDLLTDSLTVTKFAQVLAKRSALARNLVRGAQLEAEKRKIAEQKKLDAELK